MSATRSNADSESLYPAQRAARETSRGQRARSHLHVLVRVHVRVKVDLRFECRRVPLGCSDHPRHAYTPKLRAAAGRSPLLCIVCHGVPALTAAGRWLKAPALLVRSSPGLPSQLLIRLRRFRPARPNRSPALHGAAAHLCGLVARDRLTGRILLDLGQHLASRAEFVARAVGPKVRPPADLTRPPVVRQGRLPLRDVTAVVGL